MRKNIGIFVIIAFLAFSTVQLAVAQGLHVDMWTDKPEYNPGESGKLWISVLNQLDDPVVIYNITVTYPWFHYDASEDKWIGNETKEGDPNLKNMDPNGGDYMTDFSFTVPNDGRAVWGDKASVVIFTNDGPMYDSPSISVAAPSWPMSLPNLDTWMTYLTVVIFVSAIILAGAVYVSTRSARVPRIVTSRPPPPASAPRKPKET